MTNQRISRFPKAAISGLALIVAIMVVLAGSTGAAADPHPLAVPQSVAADELAAASSPSQLVWVRQDPAVVNANGDPLRYEYPDPRFDGSFTEYTVSETSIVMETKFVDHGYLFYHLTIANMLDRPPLVLNPPLRYQISAAFTHSGLQKEGAEGVGAQVWYDSDLANIEPREVLAYYPWSPNFDGTTCKEWMIETPAISREGQTFKVFAGWWNCAPCNLTWTYRAEPANAVEQLGAVVVSPAVAYRGEPFLPGEMFFPESCPLPAGGRTTDLCTYSTEMSGQGRVNFKCVTELQERLLTLIEFIDLAEYEDDAATMKKLIFWIGTVKIADQCNYHRGAIADQQLDLVVKEGAMLLSNVVADQTIRVLTPQGTATTTGRGSHLSGYNPETNVAIFRSFTTSLAIDPATGSNLLLPPYHAVELTDDGFGTVTELPHLFVPVVIH